MFRHTYEVYSPRLLIPNLDHVHFFFFAALPKATTKGKLRVIACT